MQSLRESLERILQHASDEDLAALAKAFDAICDASFPNGALLHLNSGFALREAIDAISHRRSALYYGKAWKAPSQGEG